MSKFGDFIFGVSFFVIGGVVINKIIEGNKKNLN